MKKWILRAGIALWLMCSVYTLSISFLPGPQGKKGVQGPQGLRGDSGIMRIQGLKGPQGIQGLQGPQGVQGLQGEKGDVGATGLWGLRGPQGLQGERGYSVDLPKLYKQTSPAVVWIGAEYSDDDFLHNTSWKDISERDENIPITVKWQGTGFFVSDSGLIATAGHVVENTETFIVQFQDGSRTYADFVSMENMERCDVGFIKLRSDTKCPYLKLDTKIKIGESLIILGYPWGLNNGVALTQGAMSLVGRSEPFFGVKLVMQTDVASWPGNSGSPVINMDGEVVGILIGGMRGCDNFSIVTPAQLVELAMQKALAEIGLRECR